MDDTIVADTTTKQDNQVNRNTTDPGPAYPVDDIVSAADKLFGGMYKKALVLAALRFDGEAAYTVDDARTAVESFANREVGE